MGDWKRNSNSILSSQKYGFKYCKNCLFPETKPDLHFDENGTCSACISSFQKDDGTDWKKQEKSFMT